MSIGRPRTLADRTCEQCGKRYRPNDRRRRYCSRACWQIARQGTPRGRYKPAVIKTCPACHNQFETGGGGRPRTKQVFCSRACRVEAGNYAHGGGYATAPPARQLTEVEAAWLAGLFDGEGSIVNTKRSRNGYSLRITITNTCLPLLERVLEVTGTGRIFPQTRIVVVPHHRPAFFWCCYSTNARTLLRQMLPWLIVKDEKAQSALAHVVR